MGFEKGERFGLFLPNCPYFVIAYYGALKAGATLVNYNPLYAEKELAHQIEDSGTSWMITVDLDMLYGKMEAMLAGTDLRRLIIAPFQKILPFPKNILFGLVKGKELAKPHYTRRILSLDSVLAAGEGHSWQDPQTDPVNDIALLQYTGGTTGVPKGAMLTHANVSINAQQAKLWFADIQEGEQKMLGVLPFFHVFAMTAVMNLSVLAGLEIFALPRFELEDTLKLIHKKKPHLFPAVPAIFSAMNNASTIADYDLSSLLY